MADEQPEDNRQVHVVSVKLPLFWKDDPAAWFSYVESTFNLRNITVQRTKFDHLVTSLPFEVVREVKDVIDNPGEEPYNKLKNTLISRTSISERDRLRQLLSKEDLGDRKPTQLLRHMKNLLGANIINFDQKLLRELFTQRLSTDIQQVLAATPVDTDLDSLAEIADRVMDVNNNNTVNAIRSPHVPDTPSVDPTISAVMNKPTTSTPNNLYQLISDLSKQVSELALEVKNLKARNNHSRSRRSRSNNKQQNNICFYHQKYGDKARKCNLPCSYQGNDKSEC